MKILIWNECYISGGADWSLIDLIKHWPEERDSFTIFINETHQGLELLKDKLQNKCEFNNFLSIIEDINLMKKKIFFKYFLKNVFIKRIFLFLFAFKKIFEYRKIIKKINYDIILINNGGYPGALTSYIIAIINFFYSKKKIYMIVRNYPQFNYKKNFVMFLTKIISNLFINKIITVSKSLKNSMFSLSGIKRDKIIQIYNGISISNKMDTNDNGNKDISKNSVGVIGHVEERKGQFLMVKIWHEITKKIPDAKLYLVGSADVHEKKKISDLIYKLDLKDSIIFLNYQKNIETIFSNLKIIVVPSLFNESFGRVAVEAMAFKKPVIASNTGGLNEIIDHGKNGYLFDTNDNEKLINNIIELLQSEDKRNFFIENGYKKFIENFTADLMAQKYYKIINHQVKIN